MNTTKTVALLAALALALVLSGALWGQSAPPG